jgi:glycosyltransferase involved in cell wall biosynthesis
MKISIITPSFNQAEFLERTISSVLAQTYGEIEYIIVDGGSTDGSKDILQGYSSRDNIVIISEPDKGQSDAIAKGMKLATGEYVGWINSDDVLYPECVEKIVALIKDNRSPAIAYSKRINFIDRYDKTIGLAEYCIDGFGYFSETDFSINQQGSFYRRDLLKEVGYVRQDLNFAMDLDLWLRLIKRGACVHFDGYPLAAFRRWEATKTSQGGGRFLREIRRTLRAHGVPLFSRPVMKSYLWEIKVLLKSVFSR